ncbi:hypothetical protein FZZ93_01160 [Halomonas eurihalina]|uniref:Uncharacterized protein n=1 Tax=Halomonas eurihalina TaxID=42566 RepID=A0A5D9DDE1_HALER|nr:hypothetical protein [Halomonas eurihalina]MDR5858199.1 hypothetical protein [Halomonas eurihalina]TZG41302.1 hypothetical protein FZZ93_01160 [Halomonas eurihalina]
MTRDEWLKVANPWRIVEAAAYDELARDAAVVRIIDTCLELKLVRRHDSVGYKPFSVTGTVPMPGSGRNIDQAMLAAERYRPESDWHRVCGWLLDQMPKRQAAAMMLQAARVRPDKLGSSQWAVTASQMVERQALLLRDLGMVEYVPTPFQSVEDLQKAAQRARKRLREWLAEETCDQHIDEVSGWRYLI